MESPHEMPIRHHDVIACDVYGGHPLVSSIDFYCTDPELPDLDDVIHDNVVTSNVIVDVMNATENNMTCACSAVWDPKPEAYNATITKEYRVQCEWDYID
jgi:hypothetical protein